MDRLSYIEEGNRQLQNTMFYTEVKSDPTKKHNTLVFKALSDGVTKGHIDSDTSKLLKVQTPTASRFYMLPKIHKANNPGRPITSGNNSPTEKISIYVDTHLKPIVSKLDSFVKDDMEFLQHIQTINDNHILKDESILCTMDVTSLYTNIPHDDGIRACKEALNARDKQCPATSFLSILIKLILTLNNFVFNDKHYLQIHGTAMGTSMAPNYANIFMGALETDMLAKAEFKPTFWRRHIDGIFFIWNYGEEKLNEFLTFANTFHRTIKFTMEKSLHTLNFLDITMHRVGNRLETDLFSKPTDAHQYLHWNSCHPSHTKRNLPFGLAYRLKRICSTPEFLELRLAELRDYLLRRNYSSKIINTAFERVYSISRESTFNRRKADTDVRTSRIPFVTTFCPGLPNLNEIVRKHFHILKRSTRCSKAIGQPPIVAFRRPKNLRDILVKAKLDPIVPKPLGYHKCKDKRCLTCPFIYEIDFFICNVTDKEYKIKHSFNCKSFNVIYLITCLVCKKQYVGKTETGLNMRFTQHRQSVEKNKDDPIGRHFNLPGHDISSLAIIPIDLIPNATAFKICNKETFWINTLQTVKPKGINYHSQDIYPIARHI